MSHLLNIDSTIEKLILLEHYAYGAKEYSRLRLLGSEEDQGHGALDDYWSWTKGIISDFSIECSIKIRALQDFIDKQEEFKSKDFDKKVCQDKELGQAISGNFKISIRECCNKIIHAKSVVPIFETTTNGKSEFQFWNGELDLKGDYASVNWHLRLNVGVWARACVEYIDIVHGLELSMYLGQDWS
jgi:hypothetical protein